MEGALHSAAAGVRAASGFLGLDFGDLLSGGMIPRNMVRGYYRN